MMKLMFASILFVGQMAFAATHLTPGTYQATDVDSGTIIATILVRADQTLNFTVKTPDFTMPEPGCEGKYTINAEHMLSADLVCPIDFLPNVHVDIDLKDVNEENIQTTPGVAVGVVLDIVGPEPIAFYLQKLQ